MRETVGSYIELLKPGESGLLIFPVICLDKWLL
jgi:hypothetical protein